MQQNLLRGCLCVTFLLVAPSAQAADLVLPSLKGPPGVPYGEPVPWEFEFGSRYWYSTGYYRGDLYNSSATSLKNSRLTYGNLDAHSAETFFRLDHESGLFAKGYLGGGSVVGGHLRDEDYPPGTVPYSNTISSQSGGALQYGVIDLGYNVLRGSTYKLGAFVGYHYFRERLNTFGSSQVATNAAHDAVPPWPTTMNGLDEDARWHSIRVGLSGQIILFPAWKLTGEAAWAHNWLKGTDYHNRRPDIWGTRDDGDGDGVQLETILTYDVAPNFTIGVGGRYWYFDAGSGKAHFERTIMGVKDGLPAAPVRSISERYGVFLQAAYKFGGAGGVSSPIAGIDVTQPVALTGSHDWTGLYVGANVGYGFGPRSARLNPLTDAALAAANEGQIPSSQSSGAGGFLGGGQIGFNYQLNGSFVVGAETDLDYAHVGGSFGYTYNNGNTVSTKRNLDWLGTARARVGALARNDLLLFLTGGLAFGGTSVSAGLINLVDRFAVPSDPPATDLYSYGQSSCANVGWTVGGGGEFAVNRNISLKAEYLYADLGARTFVMNDYTSIPAERTPLSFAVKTGLRHNLVRFGVNYKFD